MIEQHLGIDSLGHLMEEGAGQAEILEAVSHLRECNLCRKLLSQASPSTRLFFSEMIGEPIALPRYDLNAYTTALDVVLRRLSMESSQLEAERDLAPRLLLELEHLPFRQRLLLIRNSPRFQSWGLAEYLLEGSRQGWTEEPARAERLAQLAFEVANSLSVSGYRVKVVSDLKAEAWSYVANCRRIRGELQGSQEAFDESEKHLDAGTGDALERARVLDLKASLMRHQERFSEARRLLEFAIGVYRNSGERRLEAKALLGFGKVFADMGEVELSPPLVERAMSLLREEGDHYLEFVATTQLIYCLTELGKAAEASALIPKLRRLANGHGNRLDRCRVLWLEGKVCHGLGQVELGEAALLQAREGYASAAMGYEVALISLDLAAIYLETGRTSEVKRLATEVVPQFAAQQIHREALGAVALFEQAARKEMATLSLVEEVASKVRHCQARKGAT